MDIKLVLLNPNKVGGTITYTAHLYHVLQGLGHRVMIYQPGKVVSKPKSFGYGCKYITAPMDYVAKLPGITHVAACIGKKYADTTMELIRQGASITLHDPNDLNYFDDLSFTNGDNVIIIRRNNRKICPNATFIPHPFIKHFAQRPRQKGRPHLAVTLSRIGAIKRTKWILEANRVLSPKNQIWLRGHDDRFFSYNNLIRNGKYPEFVQDSKRPDGQKMGFAKELGQAQQVAVNANYLVDLTHIQGDGGGTQYTFLEAIDAGCALILNTEWTKVTGSIWKPGVNCIDVATADELSDFLGSRVARKMVTKLANEAYMLLSNHAPDKVGKRYIRFFKKQHNIK